MALNSASNIGSQLLSLPSSSSPGTTAGRAGGAGSNGTPNSLQSTSGNQTLFPVSQAQKGDPVLVDFNNFLQSQGKSLNDFTEASWQEFIKENPQDVAGLGNLDAVEQQVKDESAFNIFNVYQKVTSDPSVSDVEKYLSENLPDLDSGVHQEVVEFVRSLAQQLGEGRTEPVVPDSDESAQP